MRIWIHKHPVLLSLMLSALAAVATAAVILYYMSTWLILPLI
jgi:hypothetical protein